LKSISEFFKYLCTTDATHGQKIAFYVLVSAAIGSLAYVFLGSAFAEQSIEGINYFVEISDGIGIKDSVEFEYLK